MNKKVLIIYTGGTIGMKSGDSGFAPTKGYLAEAIKHIPDLTSPSMPAWAAARVPSRSNISAFIIAVCLLLL